MPHYFVKIPILQVPFQVLLVQLFLLILTRRESVHIYCSALKLLLYIYTVWLFVCDLDILLWYVRGPDYQGNDHVVRRTQGKSRWVWGGGWKGGIVMTVYSDLCK